MAQRLVGWNHFYEVTRDSSGNEVSRRWLRKEPIYEEVAEEVAKPVRGGHSTQPTPRLVVERRLKAMLDRQQGIPLALHLSGSIVPIKDLSSSLEALREQKAMLERADSEWPSLLMSFWEKPQLGQRWIPLDLRDAISSHEPGDLVQKRLQSQDIQRNIIRSAEQANLNARFVSRDEATQNSVDVLSDMITGRASHPAQREDDEPPSEEFVVTTDDTNQEILFATGYFISTKQGFGISTPATRRLQWGSYSFGINKRGRPIFSETVWTVPDVLSIHLTV
jgi:hypothetical protein